MGIIVNKSNARAFLVLCAKLAGLETKSDREQHLLTAVKEEIFRIKAGDDCLNHLSDDEIAKYCESTCDRLLNFVASLAEFINKNQAFDIIFKGKSKIIHVRQADSYTEFVGDIILQPRPDKNWIESQFPMDVARNLTNDDFFIPALLDSLEEYRNKRKISWLQIPLRICDWCHKPFFGNRYDQRFCSKIHGQRWHAERSNAKKKESAQ